MEAYSSNLEDRESKAVKGGWARWKEKKSADVEAAGYFKETYWSQKSPNAHVEIKLELWLNGSEEERE